MVDGGRKKCNPKKGSSSDGNTQPVDTQISPKSLPGEDHELYHDQNMALADDHLFYNDAFETQLVNLCGENPILDIGGETQVVDFGSETQLVDFGGETQLVNLGGETQQVDLGGETQVVDDHDGLQHKHIQTSENCNTEVAVDSDSEGSDRTEVLCDTQELSDDDSIEHSFSSIDQVKFPKSSNSNTSDRSSIAQSDVLSNAKRNSGSLQRGFTSIRAASIRASGLAAYDMSRKVTKGSTQSIKSDNPLEQEGAGQNGTSVVGPQSEVRKELNLNACEEYDEQLNEVCNGNWCKVGSSAARKLFSDEILVDINGSEDGKNDFQKTVDLSQLASDDVLAGLSYLDSQEPREESQANALEAVDKFLKLNPFDFDQHIDFGKSSIGKSKFVSAANGTKHLARRSAEIADACGIFDWDDNREDEGGGEFFQKKKELLVDRRPATEPRKCGSLDPLRREVKSSGEKEKHPLNGKKFKGSPRSDSRLMSSKGRVKSELSQSRSTKNFVEELDEQFNVGAGDGMIDDGNGGNVPDMANVGLDTQMAAEAMEALCFGVPVLENDCSNEKKGDKMLRDSSCKGRVDDESLSKQRSSKKKARSSDTRPATRQSVRKGAKLVEEHRREKVKQQKSSKKQGNEEEGAELRMVKPNMTKPHASRGKEEELGQEERPPNASTGSVSVKNCHLQQQHDSFTPVAHRTRHNRAESQPKSRLSAAATFKRSGTGIDVCETLMDQGTFTANQTANCRNMKSSLWGALCAVDHPKGKRSRRKMLIMGQETTTQSCRRSKRLNGDHTNTSIDVSTKKRKCSSECTPSGIASSGRSRKKLLNEGIDKGHPEDTNINDAFADGNTKTLLNKSPEDSNRKADIETAQSVDEAPGVESSTGDQCKASASACTTPTNARIVKSSVSPICMGNEYKKQSCRKNMSRSTLLREMISLHTTGTQVDSTIKDSRKRREMTNVRVLFSQHLDVDIIKQQKKILARLGASSSSSMSDSTHFVADEFVRTRNMLEAIAAGKPVVTHLWLESCGQASCLIDEKNHILRDAKKEREFGFSMPISLARACQHPLLQGYKVFTTPNTKPGKEILAGLVKAVHGLAVERLCRSTMKEEVIPDNLLVLSCEEDYEVCIPFLEKGATVYSSELLLNGIVTQRLEFDRYRLFTEHVKRTRSTVWVKKNNNQYLAVAKCK